MKEIRYRVATDADDAELRAVLRENAMEGWIQLGMEREPSFFHGEGLLGESKVLLAQDSGGTTIGLCTCTWMPMHLNGERGCLPYLGGLRVRSAFRHRVHLLKEGFRALEPLAGFGPSTPLAFTSLAQGNRQARRLFEAGLPGLPRYQPLGELNTWVLPTGGSPKGRLRPASIEDLPELVEFINEMGRRSQFSPHITEEWLQKGPCGLSVQDFLLRRDGGRIKACLALWDQRPFKQWRVHGYRSPLNLVRHPYNVFARFAGGVRLPAPEAQLEALFLAFAAFRDSDWEEAAFDISEGLAWGARRAAQVALLGLPAEHPLGQWLRKGRTPWIYRTCIEGVRWPEAPGLHLDPRPIHPEISLL